jgi:quinoprotein glucose dehydrogenase
MDFYGGFRPGDNLFSTSLIALDAETGERVWHFQMVHHDIWNYDTPTAPILMDVTVDGQRIPGIFQATKQAFVYALNRETGEPIWPIEERPVPQSNVPGEQLSPTQPFPTKPAPFELQGRQEQDLINYSPEIRQMALEYAQRNNLLAPFFNPPTYVDDPAGVPAPARICPGDSGGLNITNPAAADPVLGIMFIPSSPGCSSALLADAALRDHELQTGSTLVAYARNNQAGGGGGGGRGGGPGGGAAAPTGPTPENPFAGLPNDFIFDTYRGKLTAIDMNTGEHLWVIPTGDAPQEEQDAIRNHPTLQGLDFDPNRGRGGRPNVVVIEDVLVMSGSTQEGTPVLFAVDKLTGERLAQVPITFGGEPATSQYGMSSWVHNGRQHILVQTGSGLVAYALPN